MKLKRYTRDDLQILSGLDPIRKHPEVYLPAGQVRGDTLSLRLMDDIIGVSSRAAAVLQCGQWWIVASEEDWIERFRGDRSIQEFFTTVIAFPERGVNTIHGEVLLTAFAKSVFTTAIDGTSACPAGSPPDVDLCAHVARALPHWQRLVAFQLHG